MTENPSDYDLIQDGRLDSLESLVTAEYQPPAGTEYSYPVSNQGITQTQFRNMMRALGKGTITQHNADTAQSSYRLEPHASDAETNQRNTLILKPAPTFNQAETASNGFFHVLTEAMELPFPSVTTTTKYYVTVTYDPRKFKTDPLKIEVYPGTPPTSEGRDHVVLFTVTRTPNQLLSQATIGRVNQWLGHVINAWSYKELPDPTHVEYGTLAVVLIPSSDRDTGPELYSSRGVHGWVPIYKETKYAPSRFMNDWSNYTGGGGYGNVQFTIINNVVHVSGMMSSGFWGTTRDIMQLRGDVTPASTKIVTAAHGQGGTVQFEIKRDGYMRLRNLNGNSSSWVSLDGISYTLD